MIRGRFNNQEAINGELRMRFLSQSAMNYYYGTDPLYVYEVDTENGLRYYVRGVIETDGLTFDELDEMFCDLEKQMEECI